uniref:Uncharacterized protein n=1 Tax=Anguilla anguilla TaxID=7936 RepID=A0A0E9T2S3_ANGAN
MPCFFIGLRSGRAVWTVHSRVILQDERWDVDLLRDDAGKELLQGLHVMDLLLQARHTEGAEEPR